MTRLRLASALAAALLALAATTGCGSDTEDANDYVDQVNEAQGELVRQVIDTVSGAPPTNANAAGEAAAELQGVFDSTAEELEAIEAPEDVAELHAELVDTVAAVGERIGGARQGLQTGDPQQAARAARELQAATTELQTELDRLIDEINARLQE